MAENKTTNPIKQKYNMRHSMVNYYLFFMFTVFELILTNQYANARTDKFVTYIIVTSILIVSTIVISLSYYLDKNAPPQQKVVEHKPVLSLSVTDIAFIAFFISAVITTLVSDYKLDSLTGGAGRDNGLILLFLYLAMYFIISRFYYFKNYVLCFCYTFECFVTGYFIELFMTP